MATTNVERSTSESPPAIDDDVADTYRRLLDVDANTKPIAAFSTLIAVLRNTPTSTLHETLELVEHKSTALRNAFPAPFHIPIVAGTNLFRQLLINSLRQPQEDAAGNGYQDLGADKSSDFEAVRQHLLRCADDFLAKASKAREGVAKQGVPLLAVRGPPPKQDGRTILAFGASRVVSHVLALAAAHQSTQNLGPANSANDETSLPVGSDVRLRVIYPLSTMHPAPTSARMIDSLRASGIAVAPVPEGAIAYIVAAGPERQVDSVLLGAEAVTQDGGIISSVGNYQVALLARNAGIPVYVAAETSKFYKHFPAGQAGLGQDALIKFKKRSDQERLNPDDARDEPWKQLYDYTPPELITALITENGIKHPSYVCEALLEFYGSLI